MVGWFYNYHTIINQKPQSIHMYRQSDCLSLAINYYNDGLPFHHPAIHNQIADGGSAGYSAGEFPLLYYSVAKLWSVFGYHLWIYRGLNTLIFFLGLICLFRLLKGILKDDIWAGGISLLVLATPVIAFYTCNYLTNTTSLGLVMMAWYMFYRYTISQKKKFLVLCIFLFTLAGLMKVSSLITWVAWVMIWIMHELKFFKKNGPTLFHHRGWMLGGIVFLLLSLFAWYKYAYHYNFIHRAPYTFNDVYPIWKMGKKEIAEAWYGFTHIMIFQWYHKFSLILLGVFYLSILVGLLKTWRKHLPLLLFLFIVQIGSILYILCWFTLFGNHDYYLIEIMPMWILLLICFSITFKTVFPKSFKNIMVKSAFLLFVLLNLAYTELALDIRYNRYKINIHQKHMLFSTYERGYWQFFQEQYENKVKYMLSLDTFLDGLKVGRDEKILCIPDNSISIPFVMAGRKGNNEYGQDLRGKELIENFKDQGTRILIILDPEILKQPEMQEYLPFEIGSSGPIHVFRL